MSTAEMTDSRRSEADDIVRQLIAATGSADPYPLYRRLREIAPVYQTQTGMVLVSDYRNVVEVLRSPAIGQGPEDWHRLRNDPRYPSSRYLQALAEGIMFSDPPKHSRLRKLVNRAFTPRAVAEAVSSIDGLVGGLLDELAAKDSFDLVRDYAEHIPVRVVCNFLGIPVADHAQLVHWTHEVSKASNPVVTDEMIEGANSAVENWQGYAAALAADRRANPGDDLVSVMVSATEDGDLLTPDEFAVQLMTIIAAGTETTIHLICNAMVNLQKWPDERAQLRGDPSLDEGAIEELLRFEPSVQMSFPRLTLQPVEIGGLEFDARTTVVAMLAAANRDPHAVPEPDVLDIDRVRPPALQQLSFGGGIHFCLGASLARLEGRIAIRGLLDRFPNMEIDLAGLERGGNAMLRGYNRVPVSVKP